MGLPPTSFQSQVRKGGNPVDLVVRTDWGRLLVEFGSESATAPILAAIAHLKEAVRSETDVPVVAVPFMGQVGRDLCGAEGVSWLDLSGNANIVAPGLRIVVGGQKNAFLRRGRPASTFAPRSARIARQMLIDPSRTWRQRELAQATGLDGGFASRIVRRLVDDGLVQRNEGGFRLLEPQRLLDAWSEAYDFRKHTILAGNVVAASGDARMEQMGTVLEGRAEHVFTGLAAAWLLARHAAFRLTTVFLRDPPSDALVRDLGFRAEPSGANTWIVIPNDAGVFDGHRVVDGMRCAHPVQVYLDLAGHPERAREAAAELRLRHLGWRT